VNVPPDVRLYQESAVPMPSTWPSSCRATERKSFSPEPRPLVVGSKCQVAVVLNVIDPTAGA
jgi:hypothetical protein